VKYTVDELLSKNCVLLVLFQVILLLGYGPDTPPRKLFLQKGYGKNGDNHSSDNCGQQETNQSKAEVTFSWRPVIHFLFWSSLWSAYVLVLCSISVKPHGSLWEMFQRYQLDILSFITSGLHHVLHDFE
jgi:phosphatidylinositol glycan class U